MLILDSTEAKWRIVRELKKQREINLQLPKQKNSTKNAKDGFTFNHIRDKILKGETYERTKHWLDELMEHDLIIFDDNPKKKKGVESGYYIISDKGIQVFDKLNKIGYESIRLFS